MLIDTHCHIHEANYPLDIGDVIKRTHEAGVGKMICVGTSEQSSREAIEFASRHENVYAALGVHPHDTKDGYGQIETMLGVEHLVAVGEIGLDYYYTHSPREVQIKGLETQIDLALRHDLPIIFHVRDAFDDFWPIFDNFQIKKAVVHSFTDNQSNLDRALERGLYVGINGISTFTKSSDQQAVFASIPLHKLLLETDAPFLTPAPYRGKVNEPAFVRQVAEHQATIRGLSIDEIAARTTANASSLFVLN